STRLRRVTKKDMAHPHLRDHGSKTIVRLMGMYRTGAQGINSWAFVRQLLDAAKAKLGDDPVAWFLLQYESNDYVYGTNLAFLDDTIRFLVTGEREINVRTWADLVQRQPARMPGAASLSRA